MNKEEKIKNFIIEAQECSDKAKKVCDGGLRRYYYNLKQSYINKAIRLISESKNSSFSYYVKEDMGPYKKASYIIYFNFRIGNERKQISFHSFNKGMERYINSSHGTKWDRKSSRDAANELYYYSPE